MKAHFARHGVPDIVITDSGTQYTADEFKQFAKAWSFKHHPSSPGNHKSNGLAESAVKAVKRIMMKCHKAGEDPYIGLLNMRNTPQEHLTTSPAQRLFGRRTTTLIPTSPPALTPSKIPISEKAKLDQRKLKQSQKNIDRQPLQSLNLGDVVRMQPIDNRTKEWKKATVSKSLGKNTYEVFDGSKFFRRNRQYIRYQRQPTPTPSSQVEQHQSRSPDVNPTTQSPRSTDIPSRIPRLRRSNRNLTRSKSLVVMPGSQFYTEQ